MSVDRVEKVQGGGAEGGGVAEADTMAAAAVSYYSVAPGVRLNVRSGPGTGYSLVRVLPEGARIPIFCQTPGTNVSGPYGSSNIWDNIGDGQFVSDAYVKTGSDGYVAQRCSL
ncbi:SH3 domain-containing protein [Streptomyces sp. NPDC006332]|uniref:SH3 domain-containing protein n=1 Tax=Streptomyces sp. NPDC006332 TaxID=3155456 RepID=UPI0033A9641B